MSMTRKTEGNFGNVSAGVLFSKVAFQSRINGNGGNFGVAVVIARFPIITHRVEPNLVARASFPLTNGRKTRALGASIVK